MAQKVEGPSQAIRLDILTVLAHLHFARYQVVSDKKDQDDELLRAITLFHMLAAMAPERVPHQIRNALAALSAEATAGLESHRKEAATAAKEYEETSPPPDLDGAITALQDAVRRIPSGHRRRAEALSELAGHLLARFEQLGVAADLDTAINAAEQAVAASPPYDPILSMALSNLTLGLSRRYERSGDQSDLDNAIDAGRRSVHATPPGHPGLGAMLTNLALALSMRYQHHEDKQDLDEAIDAEQQAVAMANPGHAYLPTRLSNLAGDLLFRFHLANDQRDLDAAITAAQRSVGLSPPGHPHRALHLSSLGHALRTRFERTGDRADLDSTIDVQYQAVAATPQGHPNLGGHLSNLGAALEARFELTGDRADLDAAIDAGYRAVKVAPSDSTIRTGCLINLGNCLHSKFEQTKDQTDLDTAIDCWRQATQQISGIARWRLTAATSWGLKAAEAGRHHLAAEGLAEAVGLLPLVAWHGLGRATREEQLGEPAGLPGDAAAYAVLDGHPDRAVELLEQGRSVLWTQALNLRSDLARLADSYPDLASRIQGIRATLDTPPPDAISPALGLKGKYTRVTWHSSERQDSAELRRRMAREWDNALAEVRRLDGFEHFLSAIPYSELTAAAAGGHVVVVYASRYGSQALVVTPGANQPLVVDLPNLILTTVVDRTTQMIRALAGQADSGRAFPDRERARHTILDILTWLWDALAEPVLTTLGYDTTPKIGAPWPRIWWCPIGPLTLLPIHAAGRHPRLRDSVARKTECVLDRVISSYTPTLTALTHARRTTESLQVNHLAVGMPDTPNQPSLPAVPREMEVLAGYFPPNQDSHQLIGPQATREIVSAALASHSWVHLACHAAPELDPSHTGFALWNGNLVISDLAAQSTQHRDLAFLSACYTAFGGTGPLDEAIHLAAAMQFVGYRHVIAAMWTIADPPAPHVAEVIYSTLCEGGTPDASRSAEATHNAVQSLRQMDPTNPLIWAPYIHLGP
jgi:tetratricopeptide (TPR) repeat protein